MSYAQPVNSASISNGNVDTLLLPWPTGTQAGDGALLWWAGISSASWVAPSGVTFTQRSSTDETGTLRARLYSRVVTGSESGNITLSHSDTFNRQTALLVVYRNTDTSDPIHLITLRSEGSSTDTHDNPSITPTIEGVSMAVFIAERASTGTASWDPPTDYVERADVAEVGSGGTAMAAADDGLTRTYPANQAHQPGPWHSSNNFASANAITATVALAPSIQTPTLKPTVVGVAVARAAMW